MPQFARSMDVYQCFNFKKDKMSPVGVITALTIGEGADGKFHADQTTILDPEEPTKAMTGGVVGVMSHVLWETGITDAMYLSAQVSTANKQLLSAMLMGKWTSVDVTFHFTVYEYDQLKKKYFKSMWTDAELHGVLEKNGQDLNLSVADDPSSEVQSPRNYTLQIGIKPQTLEQSVHIATGIEKNLVKQWGITEQAH